MCTVRLPAETFQLSQCVCTLCVYNLLCQDVYEFEFKFVLSGWIFKIFVNVHVRCAASPLLFPLLPYQGWKPPFSLDVENFSFTPRLQPLNELEVS